MQERIAVDLGTYASSNETFTAEKLRRAREDLQKVSGMKHSTEASYYSYNRVDIRECKTVKDDSKARRRLTKFGSSKVIPAGSRHEEACSFRPVISKFAMRHSYRKHETVGDRLNRLSRPRSFSLSEQQKDAMMEREAQRKEAFPFKPDLAKSQKSYALLRPGSAKHTPEVHSRPKLSVEDRLLRAHSDKVKLKRERVQRKNELEEKHYTFAPVINKLSEEIVRRKDTPPLQSRARMIDIQRKKQLLKRKLERDYADLNTTFKPSICQRSLELCQGTELKRNSQRIEDRLLTKARDLERKKAMYALIQKEEAERTLIAQPQICPISQKIVQAHPWFQGEGKEFIHRQRAVSKSRLLKKRIHESTESEKYTFTPVISKVSATLSHEKRCSSAASGDFFTKLSRYRTKGVQYSEFVHQPWKLADYSSYKDLSFRPTINEVSKYLARNRTQQDLIDESGVRKRENDCSARKEKELEACTFAPEINQSSSYPNSRSLHYSEPEKLSTRINQFIHQREKKIEEQRMQKREKELVQCTFKPTIKELRKSVHDPVTPVVVRGLGHFLQRHDQAKAQKELQKEIEKKVFLRDVGNRNDISRVTVPEPFHLATTARSKYRQKGVLPQ